MNIYIISAVRNASDELKERLYRHVDDLEKAGHEVYLPDRDTQQNASGLDICRQNQRGIHQADEVHVFYDPESQGSHFDLGMAFVLGKRLTVVENVAYGEGKSFPRMIEEWAGENSSCISKKDECYTNR